jgi:hypothetical protein
MYFNVFGIQYGLGYTITPIKVVTPQPATLISSISPTPKVNIDITRFYTTSTTILLMSLLQSAGFTVGCPSGVNISVTVVGGGGNGGIQTLINSENSGGGGGGGGGVTTDIYRNVSTYYTMDVVVGSARQQSSLAFTPIALVHLKSTTYPAGDPNAGNQIYHFASTKAGNKEINALQNPFYPTIAYAGTDASGSTAGRRGLTDGGKIINYTEATNGTLSSYGTGGRGYIYAGTEYGRGGNGVGDGSTSSGTSGIVIVRIQSL